MLLQMKGKSREAFSQPKPPLLYTDDKRPRTDGFNPSKNMYSLPYTSSQHPPPIPPPSLQSKPTAPIGDCFVYCTVCRHGTPISLNKPIPDTFACSNCGFTCALDKHFLSYYVEIPFFLTYRTSTSRKWSKRSRAKKRRIPRFSTVLFFPPWKEEEQRRSWRRYRRGKI